MTAALTLGLDWQRILYGGVPAVGDSIDALFGGVPPGASDGPGFGWRDISVVKLMSADLWKSLWGVCGLANLSPRSLVATLSFMTVAAATVYLVRHGAPLWHS